MGYDESLAARLRVILSALSGLQERKMFGGLAFMLSGNMCCGVVGEDLVVRVGPAGYPAALSERHAREMDFTGRPLRGFVYVGAKGVASEHDLRQWVERAVQFAGSLPRKRSTPTPPRRGRKR